MMVSGRWRIAERVATLSPQTASARSMFPRPYLAATAISPLPSRRGKKHRPWAHPGTRPCSKARSEELTGRPRDARLARRNTRTDCTLRVTPRTPPSERSRSSRRHARHGCTSPSRAAYTALYLRDTTLTKRRDGVARERSSASA